MAYGTVNNGLSASTTEVSVGDEFGVELKIPAISDPLATIEFNISFPKDAFEVVAYEKPAFATTYSTVSDANNMGKITCSDFSASGDNDLTTLQAGGTISATLKVKDTAKAGQAYKIEVTEYTVDKIDEETYDSVDCAPAGVVKTVMITVKGNTPAHEHVWSEAWSKDATHHWHDCTAAGCDVTANADKDGYAVHTYNQKVTTKDYLKTAANCTDAAVYYFSCVCGAKGTETFTDGTALGHTPSTEWKSDATGHWHVCTTCKVEMDKAAHTPDHEGGATETYPIKCTECGYVIKAQLDHTHSFTQEVAEAKYLKSAAGCDSPAVYYKSCACGVASTTETFQYGNALGHSYTAEKVADQYLKYAATCTTDAVYFKSCTRCGAKGTETFTAADTALGHKGGDWQSDKTGHWKICERANCGERFSEAAHQPLAGTPNCVSSATCQVCGYVVAKIDSNIHKEIVKVDAKAPTCTVDGNKEYYQCTDCGKKFSDAEGKKEIVNVIIDAHHTLTKVDAKAPTCLEPGNNEYYTCSACGKVFKDAAGTTETTVAAETLAKSTTHSVVKDEYATSDTEHWQICKVCGTVVGKAAHKFGEADAYGRKTCADCGCTVGGTGTEGHKHAAGNEIRYDENNHWNKCTDANCDAHVNESAHKFGEKNTVTEGNKTITVETCSECGYVKRTETTNTNPGGGGTSGGGNNKPSKPKDDGKKVESGKTFDAGIGVYVGLSILSMTGSAVVIGKKRKTR